MLVEDWPLAKIRPYPNNPRVLRNAAEKVAESIKAFGWRQPIVVDADGVIIIGHSRLAAAKLLKRKTAPVHVATDLTPDQVRALRIADNKTGEFAEWDEAKLYDELAEIMALAGSIAVTGFSQAEFDAIEQSAKAALGEVQQQLAGGGRAPADDQQDDDQDFGLGGADDASEIEGQEVPPADPPGSGGTSEVPRQQPDMAPFNVLMTVDARQVLYDAITDAKQRHGLQTTAEALLVIARKYLDA